jgi:hypothetical protein
MRIWRKVGIVLIWFLWLSAPASSQVTSGESVSFHGVIEQVADDYKFVVVNEARIALSSYTKILDESGREVKTIDLKPKLRIQLEVLRTPNGFLAKTIVVKRKI